jgi:hypothetical protein
MALPLNTICFSHGKQAKTFGSVLSSFQAITPETADNKK